MDGYRVEADLYKALAQPVRLRVLDVLSRREACVCHLTAILNKRQPYVSQQLAMLRDVGLVVDRREGNLVYYRLRDQRLAALLSLGRQMAPEGQPGVETSYPGEYEGAVPGCPCPNCEVETPAELPVESVTATG